jgi:hypothetical protein
MQTDKDSFNFNENYYFEEHLIDFEDSSDTASSTTEGKSCHYFNATFNEICDGANSLISLDSCIKQCMIIMKYDNVYTYYSCGSSNPIPNHLCIPCKYSFLSIEYTHPKMKNSIFIELDKAAFYENNHVLSALFVLRCLTYQPVPYIFDTDYLVRIMDDNINMFELTHTQYIHLYEKKYEVMTIGNIPSISSDSLFS